MFLARWEAFNHLVHDLVRGFGGWQAWQSKAPNRKLSRRLMTGKHAARTS